MPSIGSETYRSSELPEATKETTISESAAAPEVIEGEDTPSRAPVLEGLNPDTAPVPGPDIKVVIHGQNFTDKSIIVWNGQDVVTVFEKENKVNTTISMTAVGVDPVYVRNEDVQSNSLPFTFKTP
jgi:hypothetical protein